MLVGREWETAPESTACRPPPLRPPRPRPRGTRSDRPAANAAGISSMNGTTSPSSPDSRERRASLFVGVAAGLVQDARPEILRLGTAASSARAAWFSVRAPRLPPVISSRSCSTAASGGMSKEFLAHRQPGNSVFARRENSARFPRSSAALAPQSGRAAIRQARHRVRLHRDHRNPAQQRRRSRPARRHSRPC